MGVSASECRVCDNTSYFNITAQQCVPCRPNSFTVLRDSQGSALSAEECLCADGFAYEMSTCVECSMNTFKSSISNIACTPCTQVKPHSGHAVVGAKNDSLCACNSGFTFQDNECVLCEPGKYKNLEFSDSSCIECPVDHYCPLGSVNPNPCMANSASLAGRSKAQDCLCNAGYEINIQYDACVQCIEGSYKNTVSNANRCQQCPYNTYNNLTAQAECFGCPHDSFVFETGSQDISDCLCNAGYQKYTEELCEKCPLNFYRSQDMVDADSPSCRQCSLQHYTTSEGSTSDADCLSCPSHASRDNGELEGLLECACNAGYTGESSNCRPCEVGKFKSLVSSEPCTDCPLHGISEVGSDNVADCRCPPGFYTTSHFPLVCVECPVGHFCPEGANYFMCLNDTFAENPGRSECQMCPENMQYLEASQHTTQLTIDEVDVNATLMHCQQYENTYERTVYGGVAQLSDQTDFCCQVEISTIATSGRLCIPWNVRYGEFLYHQISLCNIFGCSSETPTIRPGYSSALSSKNEYHDEFGSTFDYVTVFSGCTAGDLSTCEMAPHTDPGKYGDSLPRVCLNWQFERNLLCCPDFDRRQGTCSVQPHIENNCVCRAGHELDDSVCIECTHGKFKSEISNDTTCTPCPENTYTTSTGQSECSVCPGNSRCLENCVARSSCVCEDGYFKNITVTPFECHLCPEGFYCANQQKTICPGFRTSAPGSASVDECFCSPGMLVNGTGYCESCEPGFWCGDDTSYPCPSNSGAGHGNAAESDCTCNAGYWRNCVRNHLGSPTYISHVDSREECEDLGYTVWDYTTSFRCACTKNASLYGPCEVCKPDFYCTGDDVLHCPAHSSTVSAGGATDHHNCECNPGYYMLNKSNAP